MTPMAHGHGVCSSLQIYTVHKPRGTICFPNAPLAEFAVPMYRNHSSFSGPCSKKKQNKELKAKYQDLALSRGCAHMCPVLNQTT